MADSWHFGLIATFTTAAVAGPALHTSIQTHNFIQNWIEDAHDIWATQAQVDEDIQEEIQELKTAIKWVGDQLKDLQKQVILKCDWNSTQFCVAAAAAAKSLQSCPTLCDPMDCMQPTRLLRPWDSPGKNTGVRCHFLLHNFVCVLLLFISITVPTTGNKSNFIYKTYMIMPL